MNDNTQILFSVPVSKEDMANLEKRSFDTAQFLVANLNAYIHNECVDKTGKIDMHGVVAGSVALAFHMIHEHVPVALRPHVYENHAFRMLSMAAEQRNKPIYDGYALPDISAIDSIIEYLVKLKAADTETPETLQ